MREPKGIDPELIGASLRWKQTKHGWRLLKGRRRFGAIVPDGKHVGMWRCVLSDGRLSDMANLSWARNAVVEAAVRELQYEARQAAATDPRKCPENEGVFGSGSALVRQKEKTDPRTRCISKNLTAPGENGGADKNGGDLRPSRGQRFPLITHPGEARPQSGPDVRSDGGASGATPQQASDEWGDWPPDEGAS